MSRVQRIALAGLLIAAAAAPAAEAAPLRFGPVGTFTDQVREVRVADVNRDGIGDLVVGSVCRATVLLGAGNGTYAELQQLQMPGVCEEMARGALTVGDFDGDQQVDVAVARNDNTKVWVFTRTPTGTFTGTPQTVELLDNGAIPTVSELVAGDLNADGRDDLVVKVPRGLQVALATPGGFEPVVPYLGSDSVSVLSMAIGRIDAGATLDVVIGTTRCAPTCTQGVQVLTGTGDGTLAEGPFSAAGGPVWNLLAAPLRSADHDDVVITSRVVQSLVTAADGSMTANPVNANVLPSGGPEGASGAFGDVDGDGRVDVVTAGGTWSPTVSVVYGNGAGGLGGDLPWDLHIPIGVLSDAQLTDADRDGDLDVIAVAPASKAVYLLVNDPSLNPLRPGMHYANTPVGSESEPQNTQFHNNGLRPITLPKVTAEGPFVFNADTCSGVTLAPNGGCHVTLTFKPTKAGNITGQVKVGTLASTPITGKAVADRTKPKLTSSVSKRKLKTVLSRGLKVTAGCSEACTVKASLRLKGKQVGTRTIKLTTKSKTLTLKLTSKARKANAKARKLAFTVRLTATDLAGNRTTTNTKVTVKR